MMFDHEIDVCHAVLQKIELTEKQKEYAAKIIADGYLTKNASGEIVCAVPVFTKEQHDLFIATVKTIFADFLPFYAVEAKRILTGI